MLARAKQDRAQVVYAKPSNGRPHGIRRNAASGIARMAAARLALGSHARDFHSFRLISGPIGRAAAQGSGSDVYLDIALSWVASRFALEPVHLGEGGRQSSYSVGSLFAHFRRLIVSSGTRGLRLVSALGLLFAAGGVIGAVVIITVKLTLGFDTEGWASTIVVLLICSGTILFALGTIAEYIGVTVHAAMGRRAFVLGEDPGGEDG